MCVHIENSSLLIGIRTFHGRNLSWVKILLMRTCYLPGIVLGTGDMGVKLISPGNPAPRLLCEI